ncbi:MAG: methylated-DNA--[Firmicutes bacterium]|nr:methylated-DNA--[protein]-cysteine S-methyltransferase [Bacillota bacterium]
MAVICHYDSPLGKITLASDGDALIGLWFEGEKYYMENVKGECKYEMLPVFEETKRWLDMYFGGKKPDFTPKLNMMTTPFRKEVWEIMLDIGYGETMSYGEIADIIAKRRRITKMSARAVGGAVGHNSISVIIPCHRVIGSDGSLIGYAGGIERKIKLLEIEKNFVRSGHI